MTTTRTCFALAACLPFTMSAASGEEAAATRVLNPLLVFASDSGLAEEQATGKYGQPEWTSHRRFSNTRVYIQKDAWEMGIEEWFRVRTYDNCRVTQRFQQEFELGLPHRFQLDLYEKMIHDNTTGDWKQDEFAVELRYAFADWGKLWGNPTVYVEYAFTDVGPDKLETKLLFGDDIDGWHWGVNLINEHELWGEEGNEWAIAGGVSRTIVDSLFSAGIEGQWTYEESGRSQFLLGPSIQWLPTEHTHLDLVALVGLNDASPQMEAWLIFGFDFGSYGSKGYKPTSVGGF